MNPVREPEPDFIEREMRIEARPETVFPFFTDPIKILRWKGIEAVLNPTPGGIFKINTNGRDVIRGEYVEITPYSRIVFTWGAEAGVLSLPPGSTTVEVTLTPDGGGTLLHLRHSKLPTEELRQNHAMGWDHYLPRLQIVLAGGDPGIDPWVVEGRMGD